MSKKLTYIVLILLLSIIPVTKLNAYTGDWDFRCDYGDIYVPGDSAKKNFYIKDFTVYVNYSTKKIEMRAVKLGKEVVVYEYEPASNPGSNKTENYSADETAKGYKMQKQAGTMSGGSVIDQFTRNGGAFCPTMVLQNPELSSLITFDFYEGYWLIADCDSVFNHCTKNVSKQLIFSSNLSQERINEIKQLTAEYEDFVNNQKLIDNPNISSKVGFCVDYLGSASEKGSLANMLDKAFTIIKIVAIVLTIILSMIDLVSVITNEKSELKPAFMKVVKKIVIVIILLLLPTIIDMVFGLFGYSDVLCGIK